jgi:hypothetical protein
LYREDRLPLEPLGLSVEPWAQAEEPAWETLPDPQPRELAKAWRVKPFVSEPKKVLGLLATCLPEGELELVSLPA